MPFTSYHRFGNEPALIRIIERLHYDGTIVDPIYENFYRHHSALIHKLKSALYNVIQLKIKLTNTEIQEAADTSGNFLFETNMYIDGYFYNCGSALDILAREILVVFNETMPSKVYFNTAYSVIKSTRPSDPILIRLNHPSWKDEFSNYRNALTHELLLAATYSINIETRGPKQSHMIVFPLPDNPRAILDSRTYQNNGNVLLYVEENFKRVLRLINGIYGEIINRAKVSNSLPL